MRKERNLKDTESFFWKICADGFFLDFVLFHVVRFFQFEKQIPTPETEKQQEKYLDGKYHFVDTRCVDGQERLPVEIFPSHEGLFYFHYVQYRDDGTTIKLYLNYLEVSQYESRSFQLEKYNPIKPPLESTF